MFDMVLMFFTSYLDKRGYEVRDTNQIAAKYVWSFRFLCDFFAVLGTGFLTQYIHSFRLFGIFKLNRVFRLSRMIASLNTHKDIKAGLTMFKFTFYLFLLIHMMACTWYKICLIHAEDVDEFGVAQKWYPPFDWLNYTESKLFTDEISLFRKYCICLYHGVLIVGFNEMGPVNAIEMFVMYCMLLGSSIINA